MDIKIIAAIGQNNELGKNNKLLWRLPKDMKYFKEMTMGKYVVMGRKTFESLPKSLPGRTMIVISSQNLEKYSDVISSKSVFDVVGTFSKEGNNIEDTELFVIGGASIYKQFMPFTDTMYLTEVNATDKNADAYFPTFNKDEWYIQELESGIDNNIEYVRNKYVRKKVK